MAEAVREYTVFVRVYQKGQDAHADQIQIVDLFAYTCIEASMQAVFELDARGSLSAQKFEVTVLTVFPKWPPALQRAQNLIASMLLAAMRAETNA